MVPTKKDHLPQNPQNKQKTPPKKVQKNPPKRHNPTTKNPIKILLVINIIIFFHKTIQTSQTQRPL